MSLSPLVPRLAPTCFTMYWACCAPTGEESAKLLLAPHWPLTPHSPSATSVLTLLLSRRHRAPAFASRTVAGLLRGVALWLQVLCWLWG